jgi:hypothetical protein
MVILSVWPDELAAVAGTGASTNVRPMMAGAAATISVLLRCDACLGIGRILSSANSHTAFVGGEIAFQAEFWSVMGDLR